MLRCVCGSLLRGEIRAGVGVAWGGDSSSLGGFSVFWEMEVIVVFAKLSDSTSFFMLSVEDSSEGASLGGTSCTSSRFSSSLMWSALSTSSLLLDLSSWRDGKAVCGAKC